MRTSEQRDRELFITDEDVALANSEVFFRNVRREAERKGDDVLTYIGRAAVRRQQAMRRKGEHRVSS